MGQLGVTQDALVTEKLIREAPANSKLKIATGYFNLTEDYMNNLIHNTDANCDILMAHPKVFRFSITNLFLNFIIHVNKTIL